MLLLLYDSNHYMRLLYYCITQYKINWVSDIKVNAYNFCYSFLNSLYSGHIENKSGKNTKSEIGACN